MYAGCSFDSSCDVIQANQQGKFVRSVYDVDQWSQCVDQHAHTIQLFSDAR